MDRRRFVVTSVAGARVGPLAAGAQQAGKVYRIGVLSGGSRPSPTAPSPLREGLQELGWIEAEGKQERLPDLAAELFSTRWTLS